MKQRIPIGTGMEERIVWEKADTFLKRLIYIIFVFFIISILMFGIYKATPGDPVEMMIGGNKMNMKPEMYQQQYEQVTEMLGLDKPLPLQYLSWIGNMLTGNFGYSTQYKRQVIDIIGSPMKNTILLNICSMVVVFLISIPLGIATAVRKNTVFDKAVQVITIVGLQHSQLYYRPAGDFRIRDQNSDFPHQRRADGRAGRDGIGDVSGQSAPHGFARFGHVRGRRGRYHPLCPRVHDRCSAHGLHQNGEEQGASGKGRRLRTRLPQRFDSGSDGDYLVDHRPVRRIGGHRIDLSVARTGGKCS